MKVGDIGGFSPSEDASTAEQDDGSVNGDKNTPSIRCEISSKINYACHQNDISVIAELVIENPTDAVLNDLTLKVSSNPEVIGKKVWTVDRVGAESELSIRDRRVPLDGGFLGRLTESVRTDVAFELYRGAELLARVVHSISVLARNEWGGADHMPELLSAFVLPNDRAVQGIVKNGSRLLKKSGRVSSMEGYQSKSPKRVWEILSSIWASISSMNLTYAEPPASFEKSGQKIRLPADIKATGLSTCLDTSLLFSAAIEQAGLRPIVIMVDGHSLAGAWLQPKSLATTTIDDPMEIRKATQANELVIFETTMATSGDQISFTAAIRAGDERVAESVENEFVYALDIARARDIGIQPMPSLDEAVHSPGLSEGVENGDPVIDIPPNLPETFDLPEPVESADSPDERMTRWKRSLLDLSKRNRLLNLSESKTAIPIFCTQPADLEDKIAEGQQIRIVVPPQTKDCNGEIDSDLRRLRTGEILDLRFAEESLERNEIVANTDAKSLELGLLELYRKSKADLEEGGANTLFLALGMLRWKAAANGDRSYRAPIILLPVKLVRKSARSKPYLMMHDDDAVFNLTLLEMLRQDFEVEIPELAGELPMDHSGIDVPKIWALLSSRIRDISGFEVLMDVVLSTFSFAKFLMWKDLVERTDSLKQSPFVRHMIDNPRDAYQSGGSFLAPREIDSKIDPSKLMAPLNADASQIVAIHSSGLDGDFVLEGPPGTGKSETIGNVIAHNIGLNRRVLFVSEKMAALEVVHRRLKAHGLGDFCLELHSTKASKRAVVEQLEQAWTTRNDVSSVDWTRMATQLSDVRDSLNGLVQALHQPGPAGLSPRNAIGRVLRYGGVHRTELNWAKDSSAEGFAKSPDELQLLELKCKELEQNFGRLEVDDFKLFANISQANWSHGWQQDFAKGARDLARALADLERKKNTFAESFGLPEIGFTRNELRALDLVARAIPQCATTDMQFALRPNARDGFSVLNIVARSLTIFRQAKNHFSSSISVEAIRSSEVDRWRLRLDEAAEKLWPMKKYALRSLQRDMCVHLGLSLSANTEPNKTIRAVSDLQDLLKRIDLEALKLPERSPWNGHDSDLDAISEAVAGGESISSAVSNFVATGHDMSKVRAQLSKVLVDERDSLLPRLPRHEAASALSLAFKVFTQIETEFHGISSIQCELQNDLEALQRQLEQFELRERRLNYWCGWIEASTNASTLGLSAIVSGIESGSIIPGSVVSEFKTAYARWLAPLLIDSRPALTRFSTVAHEDLIQIFRNIDKAMADATAGYIRAKLSSGVPDRSESSVDPGYSVLSRELQKSVGHKPVRKLVSEMGDSLLSLTPCLMMSPLSVAQFLPVDQPLFDLVVFDEASQITVPDAIGAIARGKNCIIVGDPKQMPPTRFFQKAADDSDDDEKDLESILDEALAARVPHHRLTGHYRSRHESLICFSNHNYYQSALVTYPSADTRDSAVYFHRINGVYTRGKARTNPIEAKAVVAHVVKHLDDPAKNSLSIGVVTLNSEQQRLILDLLDHERRQNPELEKYFGLEAQNPVFVKNLETVQGDQRDVILFSITYGPTDPQAQTMPINFGPLNKLGGERRLNVAITRSTTEMHVFASFDAAMVDLTRTASRGVADLKHYLDFAARGPIAIGEAITSVGGMHAYDSDFEESIAEGLRKQGWNLRTQIGVSKFRIDLGVIHPDFPGKFLAGIECDGATYHSSPSARDRDRVRHTILENLGWSLLRVWSTDFFLDPDRALKTLHDGLSALLVADRERVNEAATKAEAVSKARAEEDATGSAVEAIDTEDSITVEDSVESTSALSAQDVSLDEYKSIDDGGVNSTVEDVPIIAEVSPVDPDSFHSDTYLPVLSAMAEKLMNEEGPITLGRIAVLIARLHGFKRTGRAIKNRVMEACQSYQSNRRSFSESEVFWPVDLTPVDEVTFRGLELHGRSRSWNDVPMPEKLGLVREVLNIAPATLTKTVAQRIGLRRIGSSFISETELLRGMVLNERKYDGDCGPENG